jgi:hypothetical protein
MSVERRTDGTELGCWGMSHRGDHRKWRVEDSLTTVAAWLRSCQRRSGIRVSGGRRTRSSATPSLLSSRYVLYLMAIGQFVRSFKVPIFCCTYVTVRGRSTEKYERRQLRAGHLRFWPEESGTVLVKGTGAFGPARPQDSRRLTHLLQQVHIPFAWVVER